MKSRYLLFLIVLFAMGLLMAACCNTSSGGTKDFSTNISRLNASGFSLPPYNCYYATYKEKVTEDEYIRHRKEASNLQAYKIVALNQAGDSAHAEVQLTSGPSGK